MKLLLSTIEDLRIAYNLYFKATMADHVDISTTVNAHSFLTEDDTYISCLKFNGLRKIISNDDYNERVNRCTEPLAIFLSEGNHRLQVLYDFDDSRTDSMMDNAFEASLNSVNTKNLDLKTLLESRRDNLKNYCIHEDTYIILSTSIKALGKMEIKTEKFNREKQ